MGQQESSYRKLDAGRRRQRNITNNNTGEADRVTGTGSRHGQKKTDDAGHISFQIPSLNWR